MGIPAIAREETLMMNKNDRPGTGVAPRPLDEVEREIVRADMAELIAREKENGDWAKWEKDQEKWKKHEAYRDSLRPSLVLPDYAQMHYVSRNRVEWTADGQPIYINDILPGPIPITPRTGIITEEIFQHYIGRAPERDDLIRVNCLQEGEFGHSGCGWCDGCNRARWMCGHYAAPRR
jgi:hypothetical protein